MYTYIANHILVINELALIMKVVRKKTLYAYGNTSIAIIDTPLTMSALMKL